MQTNTPNPKRRFGAIAAAGAVAGLIAVAIGGVAAAAQPSTTVLQPGDVPPDAVVFEVSSEDEALFEQFDQCLIDAGVDLSVFEDDGPIEFDEETEDKLDAAFDSCDPILDELDVEMHAEFGDDGHLVLSPEDDAAFEQFDQCLSGAGISMFIMEIEDGDQFGEINLDELDDMDEAFEAVDEEVFDAAFDECEPILDGLSENAMIEVFEFDQHCDEDEEDDEEDGEGDEEDGADE